MEYFLLAYLLGAVALAIAVKNDTSFGVAKSLLLGITLLAPVGLMIVHSVVDSIISLVISGLFHLGLMLGGESMDSVIESITSKILSNGGVEIKGVRSKINPKDYDKLQ